MPRTALTSSPLPGLIGLPGAPLTGGFPHIEFADGSFISTGGVKPFDILSRVVQGNEHLHVANGAAHPESGRRHPVRRVSRSDFVLRRRRAGPLRLRRHIHRATRSRDFLLGLPRTTGYIVPAPDVNPFSTYYSFFRQDSWRPARTRDSRFRSPLRSAAADERPQQPAGKFRRRLSRRPRHRFRRGRAGAGPGLRAPIGARTLRSSRPHEAGLPITLRRTDKNNVSPRFGIAWRPTADGRTVIRGGFGLYTVPLLGSVNYSMVATVTAAAVGFANNLPIHLSSRTSRRPRRPKVQCRPARSISAGPTRSTCAIRGRCSGA